MDNQKIAQQISELNTLLANADSIGVVVTEYQTLDKMAGGLALFLSLQEAGKAVQIVSQKDPLVEISNLVGIDKVKHSFEGTTQKMVVSLPYREGEVEKVSYNIEGNKLNINLFAAKDKSISFQDSDVNFIRTGSAPSLLITIGIRKMEEMAGLIDPEHKPKIVQLDTVSLQSDFGDVVLADNSFSSISEIASMIIRELNMPIDVDIAQNLLDGVVGATNNFSSDKTSTAAFASAAYLMSHNARRRAAKQEAQQARQSERKQNRPQSIQHEVHSEQPKEETNQSEVKTQEPASAETDSEGVPSDWFVPKVFKSSKPQE